MALQSSGPISLLDIQNEFGGTNPIGINEYYGADTGVPASGTISLDDFYGTSASVYPFDLNVAVVGGGGGGGNSSSTGGAGGGAGGTFKTFDITLSSSTTWSIQIGSGGASGAQGTRTRVTEGSTIIINGQWGGRGASHNLAANNGGGGSRWYPTGATRTNAANGGDGGDSINANGSSGGGGGGGGNGGPDGGDSNSFAGGAAGSGKTISPYGTFGHAGSGGGGEFGVTAGSGGSNGGGIGGYYYSATFGDRAATNGSVNTGGGGGGGSYSQVTGGSGGSGRCSIKVPDSVTASSTTGSPSVSVSGGFRIYTWTSAGTITFPSA